MSKRVALVTGAAGGIGYHIAIGFAKKGYNVIAVDRVGKSFEDKNIEFYKADLKSEDEIKEVFKLVKEKYGAIHVLVNNGAISKFNKSILDIKVEEFDNVINVNLRGSFICCKEFINANKGEDYGRIINIASTRWNQNEANWEAYGASKGGLVSLTNTLAVSLGDTPITVNAISPGWIQVDGYEELKEVDHKQHPSGRVGKPSDIVNACIFLSEEGNDFINGANLVIDGGMTKKMIYDNSDDFWSEN
ncbi:SDR family NAD(P)-dependent oxidoreductase [Clostridium sp.]|uniref:SDR family NAD(P)-dependent oxidoreductase n=1 Tax=Clostridium sp. TaxID=1506 RepID=UPI003F3C3AA2